MATYGWRKKSSVKEGLFREGNRFEFFQAVKLLEIIYKDRLLVGEDGADPLNASVWFQGKTSLSFPPGDIDGVEESNGKKPALMRVNFMSLAGALGPLPQAYTELLLQRIKFKDKTLRDFLDIFNNRLISLSYRARKKYRPGFEFSKPNASQFSRYIFSLIGMGTAGLKNRRHIKDRAFLFYAGILALQPRSMVGLTAILEDYFKIKVKGESFCGRWLYLEDGQLTLIGKSGRNQILGDSALLGGKVWDQQSKFKLALGPLKLKQYDSFLPFKQSFRLLYELVNFYNRNELDFDMTLKLKKTEVPELRIGTKTDIKLGWTSFIKTRELKKDPQALTLFSTRYKQ